jgi:hypothetical protein
VLVIEVKPEDEVEITHGGELLILKVAPVAGSHRTKLAFGGPMSFGIHRKNSRTARKERVE